MTLGDTTSRISRHRWIAIWVTLGMVACFMVLLYIPNAREAKAAAGKLAEARATRIVKWRQSQGLAKLDEEVTAMMIDYERNLSRIPTEANMPEFLKSVSGLLAMAGIQQREVVPEAPQAREGYVEQPMAITFEVPFRAGYGILDRLESMDRIVRVERLEMVSLPGSEEKVRMKMRIVIFHSSKAASKSKDQRQATQATAGGGKEGV